MIEKGLDQISVKGSVKRIIPETVRDFIRSLIKYPYSKIRLFFNRIRPDVWFFKGREITNQHAFSVVYAGSDEKYRNYINELAFKDSFEKKFMGRHWVWRIPGIAKKIAPECSFAVIEIDRFIESFYRPKRGVKMPRWVEAILDISKPIEQVFPKKEFKDMKRRIKKNQYTYEVFRDDHSFDNFYNHMYVPYIRKTFEDTAYLLNQKWYKKLTKRSELLLVKKEGVFIAGLLIEYSKKGVLMGYVGYKDGDSRYMKEGALSAVMYFTVVWLKKKGYKMMSLGPSKSFLKDGRLRYKILRGAGIADKIFAPDENVIVIFLKNTSGLRDFMANNPFVFYSEKRKRRAAFFIEADQPISQEEVNNLFKPYKNYNGIEMWCLYAFGEVENYMDIMQSSYALNGKMEIFNAKNLFI